MISFTSTQLEAWLAYLIWPFLRVSGLMLVEPILSNRGVPARLRIGIALLLTLTVAPLLPTPPAVDFISVQGAVMAAQQLLIGITLGFMMRIVLAGVEMAGHIAGLSMGLGFATFFDPQSGAQSPVLAQFLGIVAILIFLASNGHLLVISGLFESFRVLPISTDPLAAKGFLSLVEAAGQMFLIGVTLSLPLVAAILIANIGLGVLARAAPQLNLFAIGFPLMLTAGFVVLMISLPYIVLPIARLMQEAVLQGVELLRIWRVPG
jgi:flagellar biosynthetic protein FliR